MMERHAQAAGPCVIVIFGGAGDLTKRLLVPALYNLRRERLLPEEFAVFGVSRTGMDEETYRGDLGRALCEFGVCDAPDEDWNWLSSRIFYLQGEFDNPLT